jgi:hypothetical protein
VKSKGYSKRTSQVPGECIKLDTNGEDVVVYFTEQIPYSYRQAVRRVTGEWPQNLHVPKVEMDHKGYTKPSKWSVSSRGRFSVSRVDTYEYTLSASARGDGTWRGYAMSDDVSHLSFWEQQQLQAGFKRHQEQQREHEERMNNPPPLYIPGIDDKWWTRVSETEIEL